MTALSPFRLFVIAAICLIAWFTLLSENDGTSYLQRRSPIVTGMFHISFVLYLQQETLIVIHL